MSVSYPAKISQSENVAVQAQLSELANSDRIRLKFGNYGIEIVERVPISIPPSTHNQRYLKTKKEKLGHLI